MDFPGKLYRSPDTIRPLYSSCLLRFTTRLGCLLLLLFLFDRAAAQENLPEPAPGKKMEWLKVQGYVQLRYNELFETNPDLGCEQCDKSWGNDMGLFIRRMRFSITAQVTPRLSLTVQPDISGLLEPGDAVQLRDLYIEYDLDKKSRFRTRLGQTRVPFGFENLQSTRNRIPLDRNDAVNSAFINERDWGLFLYYTPEALQSRFKERTDNGLKGTGDFGLVSLGIFQGQSTPEDFNKNKHLVARVAYPFAVGTQLVETSLQAYTGTYTIAKDKLTKGVAYRPDRSYPDRRVAGAVVLSPKPFGVQMEYNVGTGPEFDPASGAVRSRQLKGGYVLLSYLLPIRQQLLYPYVRLQQYDGAKKHEQDARRYQVKELETGIEWHISPYVDVVAAYTFSNRRFEDFRLPANDQAGSLLRVQLQVGF